MAGKLFNIEFNAGQFLRWLLLFPRVAEKIPYQQWFLVASMDYSKYLEPDISGTDTSHLKPRKGGKRIPNLKLSLQETWPVFVDNFTQEFKKWTHMEEVQPPGTMKALGAAYKRSMSPTVKHAKTRAPIEFGLHRRTIRATTEEVTEVTSRPPGLRGTNRIRR